MKLDPSLNLMRNPWEKDLGGWSLFRNNVEEIVKELEPLVKSIQIAKSEKILLTEDSD